MLCFSVSVAEALDPDYQAKNDPEKLVFVEKQKYMHAVATRALLADEGKSLVRAHADSGNAQRAYSLLQTHASKSTMASVDGSALTGCITAAKLGTGTNWRGSAHSFTLHWQDQVRKHAALAMR